MKKRVSSLRCFAIAVTVLVSAASEPKTETYHGRILPLAEILKKENLELDKDAEATSLVLQTEGGKILPIVKDLGSRLFFQDIRLLHRQMEIQGRLVAKGSMLQVLKALSLKDGKLHEIYYWCETCAIRRDAQNIGGICDCCGGKMELKEAPVGK